MMIKYCSKCGSMSYKVNSDGLMQCLKCDFIGDFSEGTMEELNCQRKILAVQQRESENANTPGGNAEPKRVCQSLHDKLVKMKGRSTDGCDFL